MPDINIPVSFVPSDFYYEDYQPFNFGFYTNMNCSSVAKIVINIDGFRFLDQVIESYDHFTINGNVLTQDMNSVVLSATDENGHDFLYHDTNQNYTLDNNELKFYIGNKITSYQSSINGENYTVDEYAVCTN